MSGAFGEIGIDDLTKLLSAIEASSLAEVEVTYGDLRIRVSKNGSDSGVSQTVPPATDGRELSKMPPDGPSPVSRRVEVRAPMLGMFYRSPTPGEAPFVEVGQLVSGNDSIGLIEVMKLFNQVHAGAAGRIIEIPVEDGSLVEYDQVIATIEVLG